MNQPLSPKDERTVSANPSPDAAIAGPSSSARNQPASDTSLDNAGYPVNAYPSFDQYFYGGYDGVNNNNWNGYAQFPGADGLQIVPPVVYGDNPTLGLHSPYGFNSQMAYGQYSPASTPVPPVMMENQLFSPQQLPFCPSYYPQTVSASVPHMSAAVPAAQDSLSLKGNHSVDSGSNANFYTMHGMFGPADPPLMGSNPADMAQRKIAPPMTSTYTQPIGTFGSYDLGVTQVHQQRPLAGYGLASDLFPGQYAYDGPHQSTNYACLPSPQPQFTYPNRFHLEKGRNHRDQGQTFIVSGDRNRGPRASKIKPKDSCEINASSGPSSASTSGIKPDTFNRPDFPTDPEKAKFFIIKSFSEDNVHRSIKYSVWASTPHGNRKLDDAYREAKEVGTCPVYLFFSVNASSQFCGIAEMVGAVDFEKNADYWQQDRWSGQFPVSWHIVKDVPNSKFRHILLENNDNKPVTHSRDSQEVKLEQGIEMLKIFKDYDAATSILDDFGFYDERERLMQDRKNRQVAKQKTASSEPAGSGIINDISARLDEALQLEDKVVSADKSPP